MMKTRARKLTHYALGVAMIASIVAVLLIYFILLNLYIREEEEVVVVGAENVEIDLERVLKRVKVETEEGVVEITPEEANRTAALLIERAIEGDQDAIERVNGTYFVLKMKRTDVKFEKEFAGPIIPTSHSYVKRMAFYPPLPTKLRVNDTEYYFAIKFSYKAPYDACAVIVVFKETIEDAPSYNAIGFAPWGDGYTVWSNFNIVIKWHKHTFVSDVTHLVLIPKRYHDLHVLGVIVDSGFLSGVIEELEVLYVGERHV